MVGLAGGGAEVREHDVGDVGDRFRAFRVLRVDVVEEAKGGVGGLGGAQGGLVEDAGAGFMEERRAAPIRPRVSSFSGMWRVTASAVANSSGRVVRVTPIDWALSAERKGS